MTHPFDDELMFVTGADLTATDVSYDAIEVWGQIEKGMAVRLVVEDANGANDTMLAKVHVSTDGTNYNMVVENLEGATKVKGGYEFMIPFPVPPGHNYVKLELDMTVASTTINFTDVYAGIVPNVGQPFDRTSNWE